ncbi:hypothetical protein WOC76_09175 [Methylocystis sp. IM3]|uniref:hypothetical protein n=1 Tax=unclassified Methylocystis TaxID=2625913 RepID=UPI0030FBAFD0
MAQFSEDVVHDFLFETGLRHLVDDTDAFGEDDATGDEEEFQLWRIIRARAIAKLERLHNSVRHGEFLGSKIKLPTDHTRPMELDLIGSHDSGLFILELKVDRAAERNAFSELFAYSNYLAGMFALSGHKDITNVLVSAMEVKITRQAYLYDLLIADRDVLVYAPVFLTDELHSLRLRLHVPSDDEFKRFTNQLLSHDAMACAVITIDDLAGWIDNKEEGGSLNERTRRHLSGLSNYAAQLMEEERLHGFCFIRKFWNSIPYSDRSSLFICALNPFRLAELDRANAVTAQMDLEHHATLFEAPKFAFYDRLIRLAQRVVSDGLTHGARGEVEVPLWRAVVTSVSEVAISHNFAFRPTGMVREAYVSYLNGIYARNASATSYKEDVSKLKIEEVFNWLRAWMFMESCGFRDHEEPEEKDDYQS